MNGGQRTRRRVLFFAEAVTLAHVARPIVLAQALDPAQYEAVLACDPRYQRFVANEHWRHEPLHSIDSARFLDALAKGKPVYEVETLRRYVREDLELISRFRPDLVVGDFRLSLSVSARLAGVPYAAVSNAYWSPHYAIKQFPLPVLPMTRVLPLALAGALFQAARPLAFSLHCRPLNRVRQEYGLPSLGSDLRRVYTDADCTLYADLPSMFPIEPLPANHRYIGPVLWSPPVPTPTWWDELPTGRPLVYLTLGSSGGVQLMPLVLEALADLPLTVIASTAGAPLPSALPANARIADYLPGTAAAARASLVICNGGSPTSQQALAAGVPVLGIAGNMDQLLNMAAIVEAGAGELLRADRVSRESVRAAAGRLLGRSHPDPGLQALAGQIATFDAPRRFADAVQQISRS